ncbi:hypothetical protein L0P56_10540, partial [Anaerosalibacter bizertensis]|nr:hypothetical protein [Anaerosalibacter bizertensis]
MNYNIDFLKKLEGCNSMNYFLDLQDNQVVLFADVLGFSNLIEENKGNSLYTEGKFIGNLEVLFKNIDEYFSHDNYQKAPGIKLNWISDSIFMSCDISSINVLIEELIKLQKQFVSFGLHLRGGIAVGENYHKKNIWGPATIKAVKLESNIAIYPRIVIDSKDLKQLPLKESYKKAFEIDLDGASYLNLFSLMIKEELCNFNYINVYIKDVINKFNDAKELRVKQKYGWLKQNLIKTIKENRELVNKIIQDHGKEKLKKENIRTSEDFLK